MNKEKCEKAMNSFFELDKYERIPMSVTLHLLFCKDCRRQVHYLTLAEKLAAKPVKVSSPVTDEELNKIIKDANPSWNETHFKKNPVSMVKWIVGGILMVLFLLCFGFVSNSIKSEALFVSFYLVFAGIIVSYCAIFVGSNLDFFIKKIETLTA